MNNKILTSMVTYACKYWRIRIPDKNGYVNKDDVTMMDNKCSSDYRLVTLWLAYSEKLRFSVYLSLSSLLI